jgi:argininosuccinate lyase
MAEEMRRFSSSFAVDVRLARYDVIGSKAHAAALLSAGVLDQGQHDELIAALDQVEQEILEGSFGQTGSGPLPEDVHSAVESRLVELCGETGQRLHAGRSRNDQVVTDMLLWLKDTTVALENDLRGVQQRISWFPTTPTCSAPSRFRWPINSWRISRGWSATSAACATLARGPTGARSARVRGPVRRSR